MPSPLLSLPLSNITSLPLTPISSHRRCNASYPKTKSSKTSSQICMVCLTTDAIANNDISPPLLDRNNGLSSDVFSLTLKYFSNNLIRQILLVAVPSVQTCHLQMGYSCFSHSDPNQD